MALSADLDAGLSTPAPQWRSWLPKALFESALIVLSVLLALAVDEWREDGEKAELADQALRTFAREVRQNRAYVQDLLPYHERLEARFTRLDSLGTVRSLADWRASVPEWRGFHPAAPQATAWQTALATGALAQLEYETVAALSRVYVLQERLEALYRDKDFDLSDEEARRFVREADVYLDDAVSHERLLLAEYDRALRHLGAEPREPTRAAMP